MLFIIHTLSRLVVLMIATGAALYTKNYLWLLLLGLLYFWRERPPAPVMQEFIKLHARLDNMRDTITHCIDTKLKADK